MPLTDAERRERARESRRRWRQANPEKYAAIQARQYRKHAEQRKARARERHAADPETAHARNAEWRRTNANATAANARWRGVPLTEAGREYVPVLLADPCSYCGAPAEHVDHIDAVARGGDGDWSNLTAACAECNTRKHAAPLLTFLARAA